MSTASITHHPLPMATAAAAVVVAALAFGAVELTQNEAPPSPVTHSTPSLNHGDGSKHGDRLGPQIPSHGGNVQPGMP